MSELSHRTPDIAPGPATRPRLTMPEAEAERLRAAYAAAASIVEYGSGGSTVMAAEMPGKTILSVESDRAWAAMMRRWFLDNPPAEGSSVDVFWSDIGPTKDWGHPVDARAWRRFARYPLEIWQGPEPPAPDVVLVDGRFRTGCAMAAALHTARPIALFIDDYAGRPAYHIVERWLGRPRLTGRLAEFAVTPGQVALAPGMLLDLFDMMTRA